MVVERALAPVGEQAVKLGHTSGIRVGGLLEQRGDLQQVRANGGNAVEEEDLEPAACRVTRRLPVREGPQ